GDPAGSAELIDATGTTDTAGAGSATGPRAPARGAAVPRVALWLAALPAPRRRLLRGDPQRRLRPFGDGRLPRLVRTAARGEPRAALAGIRSGGHGRRHSLRELGDRP